MINMLWITGPGRMEWRSADLGDLNDEELLVRPVYGTVKHGTEFSSASGKDGLRGAWNDALKLHEPGRPIASEKPVGNMVIGEVIEAGRNAHQFVPGDIVYGYAVLGELVHMHISTCWNLKKLKHWKTALCFDPARFALAAIRDGNVRLGDDVAVFGLGAIGLLAVQMALLAGASRIFAVDPVLQRRRAASGKGVTVIDPADGDAGRMIKEACSGRGVDAALEFSGSSSALQHALRGAAFGGTVVCAAFPPPYPAGIDFGAEAHINRPQIIFSRAVSDPNRDHPRWDIQRIDRQCRQLITGRKIIGESIIDRVVLFSSLQEEFLNAMHDPSYAVKLGVRFQ